MRLPRKRLFIAFGVVVLLLIAAIVVLVSSREPSYAGKPLSQWVLEGYPATTNMGTASATNAIRQIGTNAVPHLVAWMKYDPPSWQQKASDLYYLLTGKLRKSERAGSWIHKRESLAENSARAFATLGPNAIAAYPELCGLIGHTNLDVAERAVRAISFLGPEALGPLMGAVTNARPALQSSAIYALRNLGTNARPAVPLLVQCLTNQIFAVQALNTLQQLQLEPDLVQAGLANLAHDLPSSRIFTTLAGVHALERLGTNARPAIPGLLHTLNNPRLAMRRAASNAILAIAPSALPKDEGVKR